jgi:hypothetical protein
VESGAVEAATLGGKKQTFTAGQTFCQSGENLALTSAGGGPTTVSTSGGSSSGGGGCVEQNTPVVVPCQ